VTALVEPDPSAAESLQPALGGNATILHSIDAARTHLQRHPGEYALVLGPSMDIAAATALASTLRVSKPALGVILVRRRVDTTVLSTALRAGICDVVEERDLAGLGDAIARAYTLHGQLSGADASTDGAASQGRLLTVFSPKGGVGKTTVATNLAAALAEGGHSVCLVDLDLAFGDVAIVLQLEPTRTIADLVGRHGKLDPGTLASVLTPHPSGLKALVAPVHPEAKDSIDGALVTDILRMLKDSFDFVVVDTPPAFDEVVLHAFDASDLILLVGTLDVPALKSLKITTETLSLLNQPPDRWRLVINRADQKVGLSASDVEHTLKLPITAQIPQSREVPNSINHGKLIVLDSPRHSVSHAIHALADACLAALPLTPAGTHDDEDATADGRRRGLLRRKVRQ
jgi:pilus assembly protein CpaE